MKKTKKIIFSALLGACLFNSSCTDGFDAINTNPNDLTEEQWMKLYYKTELGSTIRKASTLGGADVHQRIKALYVDVYTQYVAGTSTRNYTQNDGYQTKYWTDYYSWLASVNAVINACKDDSEKVNSLALARIWRVFIQSQATDLFGPTPFPTSPSDGNVEYKPLKDQYDFFFAELDQAIKQFDSTKELLTTEDNIYWGDINKWKRFANSLRLRLAIKLSEIDPVLCKTQAQAAATAEGGLLSPTDNAQIAGVSGWGNQYPYYMYQVSWGDRQSLMSSMEKVLTNIGGKPYDGTATTHPANLDPRGTRLFGSNVPGNAWVGLAPGLQTLTNEMKNNASAMSTVWIIPNDSRKTDIFLYPEVCFLMAEGIERGFISGGSAKDWYEKGVKASFTQWGLDEAKASTYLASTAKNKWGTSANYDDATGAGNTKLEKIISQKYIANYPDISYQSWNDKRRLNLPALDIPEYINASAGTYPKDGNIQNPANYISRIMYPQSEAQINNTNYQGGVSQLKDGDKTSSPIWWASKRSNYCTSVVK